MDAETFQFWHHLIDAVEKDNGHGRTHLPTFWKYNLDLEGSPIAAMADKCTEHDLIKIWEKNVEPRLDKLVMDPYRRRKYGLTTRSMCLQQWEQLGATCAAARAAAREKLAKFRIGSQLELLPDPKPERNNPAVNFDWVGKEMKVVVICLRLFAVLLS